MNKTLKILWEYIKKVSKYERDYYRAKEKITTESVLDVMDTPSAMSHEMKIVQSYRKAVILYNRLKNIAIRYKNGEDVEIALQNFNNSLNNARLPIFEKTFIRLKKVKRVLPAINSTEL